MVVRSSHSDIKLASVKEATPHVAAAPLGFFGGAVLSALVMVSNSSSPHLWRCFCVSLSGGELKKVTNVQASWNESFFMHD